jgi:hypothetical protein
MNFSTVLEVVQYDAKRPAALVDVSEAFSIRAVADYPDR